MCIKVQVQVKMYWPEKYADHKTARIYGGKCRKYLCIQNIKEIRLFNIWVYTFGGKYIKKNEDVVMKMFQGNRNNIYKTS